MRGLRSGLASFWLKETTEASGPSGWRGELVIWKLLEKKLRGQVADDAFCEFVRLSRLAEGRGAMSDAGCCLHCSAVLCSLGGHAVQSAFGCVGLHAYVLVSPIRGAFWMPFDSARSLMCVVPKKLIGSK